MRTNLGGNKEYMWENNSRYNIVYAADDGFTEVMGVSILSLFENNQSAEDIRLTILDSGITKSNKDKIETICKKYRRPLPSWVVATDIEKHLEMSVKADRGSIAQYARIFLTDIFSPNVKRVLYLDCDTLIVKSINELWNLDLEGNTIAALKDAFSKYYRKNVDLAPDDIMFNSGVMLIDLEKWRSDKVEDKLADFIRQKKGKVQQGDQGVLNAVLSKETLVISPKYNFATVFTDLSYDEMILYRKPVGFYSKQEIDKAQQDIHIIHFTSHFFSLRPWQEGCTNKYLDTWLNYRKLSPWKDGKLATVNNSFKKQQLINAYQLNPKLVLFLASIFQIYLRPLKNRI
ncbi:glycosyltransferase family 8 protein [Ligilactobacillus agilis]|nr:glycosyltransferase family 8 protein [Ligilactobacillus agilis]